MRRAALVLLVFATVATVARCHQGVGRAPAARPSAAGSAAPSSGWTLTVYYTAVQRYHTGKPTPVTGCPVLDCTHGHTALGTYPADFVQAVHDEGTGHTADGRYLNWSSDTGYWLDSAPRDSAGGALRPFESAAADPDVLRAGARFTIADCGHGSVPDVCAKLRASHWVVTDEFTPGLGGQRHVDLYIGEETGPGFTDGPWYTTLEGAALAVN
jgi:hypothetical protein